MAFPPPEPRSGIGVFLARLLLSRAALRFARQGEYPTATASFTSLLKLFQDEILRRQAILGRQHLHVKLFQVYLFTCKVFSG
jgi:hypothetical protein